MRLKLFINFVNYDLCVSFCFSGVYPVFCTTTTFKKVFDQIFYLRDVIAAEVCLLGDDGVTHVPVICKNIIKSLSQFFLPGIGIDILSCSI